jgi:hypothetical protein
MSPISSALEIFHFTTTVLRSYWQRDRGLLGPPQVLLSVMGMTVLDCPGYEQVIEQLQQGMGAALGWTNAETTPSAQALSQARRKFPSQRCREVFDSVQSLCASARAPFDIRYGEFRLLAIDGTKLPLPSYRSIIGHFGCPTQAPSGPQASFTLLWDVGANRPVDWRVGSYRTCERIHALEIAKGVGRGDLVLADRNFASRRILFHLQARGADWLMCIRGAGSATLREVTAFVASGALDQEVTMEVRDLKVAATATANTATITVRLLRKDLPDGTVAVFITSLLDKALHPASTLLDLYCTRWRVETAFREMKVWHGLERFHARYPDGILQEIAALMIFLLLTSACEARVRQIHGIPQQSTPTDHQPPALGTPSIRYNRRIAADCTWRLINAAMRGETDFLHAFEHCLNRLWRYRQAIRPNRHFPRIRKSPARGWKDRNRKGC